MEIKSKFRIKTIKIIGGTYLKVVFKNDIDMLQKYNLNKYDNHFYKLIYKVQIIKQSKKNRV